MGVPFNKIKNKDILANFLNEKALEKQQCSQLPSTSADSTFEGSGFFYALIRNIPTTFHAKDLRRYFSEYVENGRFSCFHFRHRPELQMEKSSAESSLGRREEKRCCCVVRFSCEEERSNFKNDFHLKFWTDAKGNDIPLRCFVFCIKVDSASKSDEETLTTKDLVSLIELRPPAAMPYGNVGTPSEFFLEEIRQCKLPASIIAKLGLQTQRRVRRYGAVALTYPLGTRIDPFSDSIADQSNPGLASSHQRMHYLTEGGDTVDENAHLSSEEKIASARAPDNDEGEDNDDDQCEEWERYEALYNDVTEQDRTKPKKYEEEMEVTWEKGGPGLVWYTDTFQWNEIEQGTDSDWLWADDWDVDYSVYYDRAAGNIDTRQAVEIREDEKMRAGEIAPSVFRKKDDPKQRKRRHSDSETTTTTFGGFEKHSKGIASKVMKRLGWKPGSGLGKNESGRVETVSAELTERRGIQTSGERTGFGYHGEQLQRTGFAKPYSHTIATVYDVKQAKAGVLKLDDGRNPILRSQDPTHMKYR